MTDHHDSSRRRFLKTAGAVGIGSGLVTSGMGLTGCSSPHQFVEELFTPIDPNSPFQHGVASGDPLSDRVVLWTRITDEAASENGTDVPVVWRVAADPGMETVILSGVENATAEHDYCVKVDPVLRTAAANAQAQTYYYQFIANGQFSAIGRTRLLPGPDADVAHLRFAVFSCSSLAHGFFNTYAAALRHQDLDCVLHLGDYIYEYANGEYGDARDYEPPNEMFELEHYRMRHAQYKREPELRLLHQQNPFINTWDDHESTNDSWRDGAENHTEGAEGSWPQRKAWAIQAYHEWLPIRPSDDGTQVLDGDLYRSPDGEIYRRFQFGNLADLIILDTRLEGRDEQVHEYPPGTPEIAGFPAFTEADVDDPGREMISGPQQAWLDGLLLDDGTPWKLLGQQIMLGQLRFQAETAVLPARYLNPDQWDGYPLARQQIWDAIEASNANNDSNVVVLTGDIHTSWAIDITRSPDDEISDPITGTALADYESMAVEFVTPSVTSPGLEMINNPVIQEALNSQNPHMEYIELGTHGYTILDVQPGRVENQWWFTGNDASLTTRDGGAAETFARAHRVAVGDRRLGPPIPENQIAQPRNNYPAFAPVDDGE